MSFFFPSLQQPAAELRYCVRTEKKSGSGNISYRHSLLFSATLATTMEWKAGLKVLVGFGEPGTEDLGRLVVKPADRGTPLRHHSQTCRGLVLDFRSVPDWITREKHDRVRLNWRRAADGSLIADLPDWAFIGTPRSERADPPQLACIETNAAGNSSRVQAGRDERPESCPKTGAPIEGPSASDADGMATGARPAVILKDPRVDTRGGVTPAPLSVVQLREKAVFDMLAELCELGAETPTVSEIASILDFKYPSDVTLAVGKLTRAGKIQIDESSGTRVYKINGKSTRPKISKPAPLKAGPLPAAPSEAKGKTVEATISEIMEYLTKMGLQAVEIGHGNFFLNDQPVDEQTLLDRANRKRRLTGAPPFALALS